MFITSTKSQVTDEQREEVETFLADFLPRLEATLEVEAAYHFDRRDEGETWTIVVWTDQAALQAYRESELFDEALARERELGLESTREGYSLSYPPGE